MCPLRNALGHQSSEVICGCTTPPNSQLRKGYLISILVIKVHKPLRSTRGAHFGHPTVQSMNQKFNCLIILASVPGYFSCYVRTIFFCITFPVHCDNSQQGRQSCILWGSPCSNNILCPTTQPGHGWNAPDTQH